MSQLKPEIILKDKEVGLPLNKYGLYPAAYCRSTGLPMYNNSNYGSLADKFLSRTRCQKLRQPVQQDEQPAAFYRLMNGYCELYLRNKNS